MRTIIRATDVRAARRVQERLAEAGCEAAAFVGADAPSPEGEDVLVIAGGSIADAAALGRAARAKATRPVITLLATNTALPPTPGLAEIAPFDGALALDAPDTLLGRQIAHALRMGATEEEVARRRLTAEAIGLSALTREPEPRRLKSLYIGAPSPFFLSLERTFAAHAGGVTAAFSSFTGFDHLHDEAFDAVVLNGATEPQTAIALCAALRRNANFANMPTLMVTAPDDANTNVQAIERGAAAVTALGGDSAAALGWLFDAIRRERRRRTAEQEALALRDRMGDPRTGLFTTLAFEAHLQRLAEDHHATGRAFAIAVLNVSPAPGATAPPEPVWKKGFTEIAGLAARLVRDSDCGAAYDERTIVLALPFTDLAGAKRAGNRVAAVAECTSFAAGDNGAAPLVFEQAAAELQPGESGLAMLARARAQLEPESVRA